MQILRETKSANEIKSFVFVIVEDSLILSSELYPADCGHGVDSGKSDACHMYELIKMAALAMRSYT